jgi:hypothetical protein
MTSQTEASILLMMEVGLMIRRFANLAATYIFIAQANHASHFTPLGAALLFLIPPYSD